MPKGRRAAKDVKEKSAPVVSPEARENQLIALAYDVAEERLRNGTASAQEVVHFLKLGSTKEREEREMMHEQRELIRAKTTSIQSSQHIEELVQNAIDAMRMYSGVDDSEDDGGNDYA